MDLTESAPGTPGAGSSNALSLRARDIVLFHAPGLEACSASWNGDELRAHPTALAGGLPGKSARVCASCRNPRRPETESGDARLCGMVGEACGIRTHPLRPACPG